MKKMILLISLSLAVFYISCETDDDSSSSGSAGSCSKVDSGVTFCLEPGSSSISASDWESFCAMADVDGTYSSSECSDKSAGTCVADEDEFGVATNVFISDSSDPQTLCEDADIFNGTWNE